MLDHLDAIVYVHGVNLGVQDILAWQVYFYAVFVHEDALVQVLVLCSWVEVSLCVLTFLQLLLFG